MKRVVWVAAAISAALLAGCSSPNITLGQPNAVSVAIGTSFAFNGQVQNSSGTIVWKVDGPGSLSNTTGPATVYLAPSTYDPANNKATLTASISIDPDTKQEVAISIQKTQSTSVDGGIPGLGSAVTVTYDERDIPTINCTKSVDCYA